jgi:hypothetical protein
VDAAKASRAGWSVTYLTVMEGMLLAAVVVVLPPDGPLPGLLLFPIAKCAADVNCRGSLRPGMPRQRLSLPVVPTRASPGRGLPGLKEPVTEEGLWYWVESQGRWFTAELESSKFLVEYTSSSRAPLAPRELDSVGGNPRDVESPPPAAGERAVWSRREEGEEKERALVVENRLSVSMW